MNDTAITTARALFPRGLHQPQDSYRFGADALLLAAFAAESLASLPGTAPRKMAELGSGCGAALLGLCLYLSSGTAEMPEHCHQADALPRQCPCTQPSEAPSAAAGGQPTREGRGGHNAPHLHALGLEQDTALCAAATANARLLGLEDVCRFRQGDLADTHFLRDCGENAFHLVLANPPYALTGSGRPSASARRDAALRGPASLHDGPHARQRRPAPKPGASDPLAVFCHAARRLLRHHGLFCCIFPAEDLSRLLSTLERERLGCRRILPLCPAPEKPPNGCWCWRARTLPPNAGWKLPCPCTTDSAGAAGPLPSAPGWERAMRKKDSALPSLKTGSHDVQRPGVAMAATRKCLHPPKTVRAPHRN